MKNMRKCVIVSGAVAGTLMGAAIAYLTVILLKNKMTMCEMMRCKAKEAFKSVGEKISI